MNKETVIKILKHQQITQQEAMEFISDYVKDTKEKEATSQELGAIFNHIQQGVFNLQYAAKNAGIKLGLNIMNIYDKNGQLIRVDVYE